MSMEAAALAMGAVTLPALFNNAVDCFEYVQLARNFGSSSQTCLLRLDNARLRLSRWGQAAGLSGSIEAQQGVPQSSIAAEDVCSAERILGQILVLFSHAEVASAKGKERAPRGGPNIELDVMGRGLHDRMRALSVKRQNQTTLWQKTRWALRDEKHVRRLVQDVTELVSDLIELFPALQPVQRDLCEEEISNLGTDESLHALKDVVEDQDGDLNNAILKALESAGKHASGNTWKNYNSKVAKQVGSEHVQGDQNFTF